ncbi:MAG: outer membrane beta-barrel protein [Mariprofundaceae bacterium]|nr:outer membrane beta-barrel protein [Mariprofundaceae bacterium]
MRKYLHIALAICCLVVIPATVVHAEDFYGNSQASKGFNFDIRPYAGIGFGAFGLELKAPRVSQKNTVFGGFGKAGVDIGDYLGVEIRGGSTTSGTTDYPSLNATLKIRSSYFISYLAKLQSWESAGMKVYALVGATTAKFKATATATGLGAASASSTKTGVSYGFGINYHIQDSLTVGGEWMQYWTNVSLGAAGVDANMWGAVATVAYHF